MTSKKGPGHSSVTSLPSRAWSCNTLEEGVAACARIAGVHLEPDQMKDAMQALPASQASIQFLSHAYIPMPSSPCIYMMAFRSIN